MSSNAINMSRSKSNGISKSRSANVKHHKEIIDLASDSEDSDNAIYIMDSDEEAADKKKAALEKRAKAKMASEALQKVQSEEATTRRADQAENEKRQRQEKMAKRKADEAYRVNAKRADKQQEARVQEEQRQREARAARREDDIAKLGRHWHAVEGWRG